MPLGVGDDCVTANTPRVAAAQLNVLHVEVPESQVVGEHVELGQEGGPGLIGLRSLVETVEVDGVLLPEEGKEKLHDRPRRVLQQLRLLQGGEGVAVCDLLQQGKVGLQQEGLVLLCYPQQTWTVDMMISRWGGVTLFYSLMRGLAMETVWLSPHSSNMT